MKHVGYSIKDSVWMTIVFFAVAIAMLTLAWAFSHDSKTKDCKMYSEYTLYDMPARCVKGYLKGK